MSNAKEALIPNKMTRHFFVDEAGDMSLFDKKGRILVGRPGVSTYFMVGMADIPKPEEAYKKLEKLRARLLGDPYFHGVPSMQESARKTALSFHAKDDLPEVRREVFTLLPSLGCRIQVVIRRKENLVEEARALFKSRNTKLKPNDIYDDLVSRLFRNILHKADENKIVFARRGKSDRRNALEAAIKHAKWKFSEKCGVAYDKPTAITAGHPYEYIGLQVIDYYLWAVQRLFERGEDRFFMALHNDYRLIMDIDNRTNKEYGEWFSDKNLLTLDKIKKPSKS